jgi:hypothetical protein
LSTRTPVSVFPPAELATEIASSEISPARLSAAITDLPLVTPR